MEINKNISMCLSTLIMMMLALALSSCVKQELPDGGGEFGDGYASLTLELKLPGEFTLPATRALTDEQQNDIKTATVFIVKDNIVIQGIRAEKVEQIGDAGIKTMTVHGVKTSHSESDKYDIVVIGNMAYSDENIKGFIGKTKTEFQQKSQYFFGNKDSGKFTDTKFCMWGEMNDVLIHPISNTFQMNMLRSLARVDIGLGEYDPSTGTWPGLDNFTMTDVHLIAQTTTFYIIPDPKNVGADGNVIAASGGGAAVGISTEATYQGADEITDEKYSKSTIFIAESKSSEISPVKLIIGGLYQGEQTYYRVDLLMPIPPIADKKFKDILRNHIYRISVAKILAPGYSTREEAAALPPLDKVFVTRVESIDEGQHGDILFDENSSISTDASHIVIYGRPDGNTKYTFATIRAVFNEKTITKRVGAMFSMQEGYKEYGILKSGEDMVLEAVLPRGSGGGMFMIRVGRLRKDIHYLIQPPIDAHFDFMPFGSVASMTINDPKPWLTLSNNRTYVKSEQQSASITGDAKGKAVVHFDENIATTGAPRMAEVSIIRTVGYSGAPETHRIIFEQLNLNGMVLGLFGGAKDDGGYTKQLAIELVEEYAERHYDDYDIGRPVDGLQWGFNGTNTNVIDIEQGRLSTITLAKTMFADNKVVTNETDLSIYNNYAARYCYDKNRDTNGNGTIDDAEVLWYLPAQNQLMGAWIAHEGVITPLGNTPPYNRSYWSATESIMGSDLYGFSWTVGFDTGVTHGGFSHGFPFNVRCVRDL